MIVDKRKGSHWEPYLYLCICNFLVIDVTNVHPCPRVLPTLVLYH